MTAQAMGGFGAGTNTTVIFSMITTHFPLEKQQMIGILEGGIGLGLLLGPILGAMLYEAGGYCCPFWTLGFLFLTMFPLLSRMISLVSNDKMKSSHRRAKTEQEGLQSLAL